jgi:hypothetical protein
MDRFFALSTPLEEVFCYPIVPEVDEKLPVLATGPFIENGITYSDDSMLTFDLTTVTFSDMCKLAVRMLKSLRTDAHREMALNVLEKVFMPIMCGDTPQLASDEAHEFLAHAVPKHDEDLNENEDSETTPDFRGWNHRRERFSTRTFMFVAGYKFAGTNSVSLSSDGTILTVQMFNKNHNDGFFVDDYLMLLVAMLRGLVDKDLEIIKFNTQNALNALMVTLFILDNGVMETGHKYADSPAERSCPPDSILLPSPNEWLSTCCGFVIEEVEEVEEEVEEEEEN